MTMPSERDGQLAEASQFEELPLPSPEQVQQAQAKAAAKRGQGTPRLLEPNRRQIEMRASDLELLLAADHRARLVWGYVVRQNLSKLFDAVKARGSNAGRAAIVPRILFALWLYATLQGVGSGREVARLKVQHYGLLANGNRRDNLALARELLHMASPPPDESASAATTVPAPTFVCAHCGHAMVVLQVFLRGYPIRAPPAS